MKLYGLYHVIFQFMELCNHAKQTPFFFRSLTPPSPRIQASKRWSVRPARRMHATWAGRQRTAKWRWIPWLFLAVYDRYVFELWFIDIFFWMSMIDMFRSINWSISMSRSTIYRAYKQLMNYDRFILFFKATALGCTSLRVPLRMDTSGVTMFLDKAT